MEILEWLRFIIGALFLVSGLIMFGLEVFGSYRLSFVLNRMHAAAIGDTLGISFSLFGLIIFSGWNFTSVKLFLVICMLWLASPVSSHMISRFEVMTNENINQYCEIDDEVKEDEE